MMVKECYDGTEDRNWTKKAPQTFRSAGAFLLPILELILRLAQDEFRDTLAKKRYENEHNRIALPVNRQVRVPSLGRQGIRAENAFDL